MVNGKLIVEGRIINHNDELYGQIEINKETGLIEGIGNNIGTADLKLTDGELIFPGFSDPHVHARQDESGEYLYKEDFQTASMAAINGGVVVIADMPNNSISPVDIDSYTRKQGLTKSSRIPVLLYAGIGPDTEPLIINVPYKAFMGPSVGDLFFDSNDQLEKTIMKYDGKHVSFHPEDPEIIKASESAMTHELRRPREAENNAIKFALKLIEKYNLDGKICHCSTYDGLEMVFQAKGNGIAVACEVTPHHLYFDETMLNDDNRLWLQMNPPIRTCDDRMALIEGLKKGTVDYIATDHAPHTIEEKKRGMSGVPHLDTLAAFTTLLMNEHGFSPQDIARVCSYNPGRFINNFMDKNYGVIKEGCSGSLTIINPNSPVMISRDMLKTKCGWSPFENVVFPGNVVYTIVKGEIYRC